MIALTGEKVNARVIKPGLYTARSSLLMPENRNPHIVVWRGTWTVNVRHSVKDVKWLSINDNISLDAAMLVLDPNDVFHDEMCKHLEEQRMLDDYFLILSHKHGPVFVDAIKFYEHPFDKID